MYRGIGKAGGVGGSLAATGAPNMAVFLAAALGVIVAGVCLLRAGTVLRKPKR
jgi:hypothetical protein